MSTGSGSPKIFRVCIQGVRIVRDPLKETTCVYVCLDGDTKVDRLSKVKARKPLEWNANLVYELQPSSTITLGLREVLRLSPDKLICDIHIRSQDIWELFENTRASAAEYRCSSGQYNWSITFSSPPDASDGIRHVYDAFKHYQNTSARLNYFSSVADSIFALTGPVAEFNGIAKCVVGSLKAVNDKLQKQQQCDERLYNLAEEMSGMLPLIQNVQEYLDMSEVKKAVKDTIELIEQMVKWLEVYMETSFMGHVLTFSVEQSGEAEDFERKFKILRDRFNSGVSVENLRRIVLTEEHRLLATLNNIKHSPHYNSQQVCMAGTRTVILEQINNWVKKANSETILWLHGLAGAGKTAIASSIAQGLEQVGPHPGNVEPKGSRLGANFFCSRDFNDLSDPNCILPNIAYQLANFHPLLRKAFAKAVCNDPGIASKTIQVQFRCLFEEPLKELSKAVSAASWPNLNSFPSCVIVIDALDECGSPDTRKELLCCLCHLSSLVDGIKTIVTSRPDPDIQKIFNGASQCLMVPLGLSYDTTHDISLFVRARMSEIAEKPHWPNDNKIDALVQHAEGLFIWAATACNYIENHWDIEHALGNVLSPLPAPSQDPYAQLDALYKTVLLTVSSSNIKIFEYVVGTIVTLRAPLPAKTLGMLLQGHVSDSVIKKTVEQLRSVLFEDENGNIRVCHPSFVDFLTDKKRSPSNFYIDAKCRHLELAQICLQKVVFGVRFNICNLETSYCMNAEVTDLDARIECNISADLHYSCVHWAGHLRPAYDAKSGGDCVVKVQDLLGKLLVKPQLLYWLEALSLLGQIHAAISGLMSVVKWIDNHNDIKSKTALDAQRFIIAFCNPISQSAPHIYLSALPFAPKTSKIAQNILPYFQNMVSVLGEWDTAWSACLWTLDTHTEVTSVAYSPDGQHIILGCQDKTVQIWDAETGVPVSQPLVGHTGVVWSVAFSPDGQYIVSGSNDKTILIWDTETGLPVCQPLIGHTSWVNSVAFSPDGRHIISGSQDKTVQIWDAVTGVPVSHPLTGHTGSVESVAFSPNGRYIVSGSQDQTVRIWDVEERVCVSQPFIGHTDRVTSVGFSPDSKHIVSGSGDMTVQIWDIETRVSQPLVGHTSWVNSVTFSPDGQHIISGSYDDTVQIWDAETGVPVCQPLTGHTSGIKSIDISPDGWYIVSGSGDKTVRIWDTGAVAHVIQPSVVHARDITCVAFSPDGLHIISGSQDGMMQIWDSGTGVPVCQPCIIHTSYVNSIAFSSDGQHIVSGSGDKTVQIWNAKTGVPLSQPLVGHTEWVYSVAFSPDGKHIASGSGDGTIRIWDVKTGVPISEPLVGHTHWVWSVAFSPDGQHIVSGSEDQTVRIWDVETAVSISQPLVGHTDWVMSVAFSPDGKHIVSGSHDNTVQIWDADTGLPFSQPLVGHTDIVKSVAFSPDGQYIISGSEDKTVRVWDAKTGLPISYPIFMNPTMALLHSHCGLPIIPSPNDKIVSVMDEQKSAIAHPGDHGPLFPVPLHMGRTSAGFLLIGGSPLLWIPEESWIFLFNHTIVMTINNQIVILNLSNFCHGTRWQGVHPVM